MVTIFWPAIKKIVCTEFFQPNKKWLKIMNMHSPAKITLTHLCSQLAKASQLSYYEEKYGFEWAQVYNELQLYNLCPLKLTQITNDKLYRARTCDVVKKPCKFGISMKIQLSIASQLASYNSKKYNFRSYFCLGRRGANIQSTGRTLYSILHSISYNFIQNFRNLPFRSS